MNEDVVERARAAMGGRGTPGLYNDYDQACQWVGVVLPLVAEIEGLRGGLARIERFSRHQALSDRARSGPSAAGYHSDERYWLDLLAIIERVGLGG